MNDFATSINNDEFYISVSPSMIDKRNLGSLKQNLQNHHKDAGELESHVQKPRENLKTAFSRIMVSKREKKLKVLFRAEY